MNILYNALLSNAGNISKYREIISHSTYFLEEEIFIFNISILNYT